MNIELSEDKINRLVEEETRKEIKNRITRSMNDGCASWFTQQNIQRLTNEIIYQIIDRESIKEALNSIDKNEFSKKVGDQFASAICAYLFD